ncbi:MAG: divergent polysaccharide deacetylase family protein [Desulfuromonadales bacterium]
MAAAAAMVAMVFAGLYLHEGRQSEKKTAPGQVSSSPYEFLEDVRIEVESLLLRNGASLEGIRDGLVADTLVFTVEGDFPSPYLTNNFRERLERISPRLRLFSDSDRGTLRVVLDHDTICRVEFPGRPEVLPDAPKPRLAIVMDDLGREMKTARALISLEFPVTFSILPGTSNSTKVANLAHRGQREVLVHIPMEPQGFPAVDPGSDALLLDHSTEELRSRLGAFWQRVPYAVGGNNHMGSRFTENTEAMTTVLEFMRENAFFFIDSRTSGRSVAYRLASESGVGSASRDVFLDNEQDVEKIRLQIRKLKKVALEKGYAIGICHPYPETLEALRLESAALADGDVKVVPVSELLNQVGS